MVEDRDLDESLVASIQLPDLGDAIADLGEVALDSVLTEGPARDIPVIGTLIRLAKTVGVVRDFVFFRKVTRFLARLGEVPAAERDAFVRNLETKQERQRVGETLVLLLDRLDDMDKPDMLARLFAAHVSGKYDFTMFRKLATALDRLSLPALPELRRFYGPESEGLTFITGGDQLTELAAAGLIAFQFHPTSYGMTGGSFVETELGRLFLKVIDAA